MRSEGGDVVMLTRRLCLVNSIMGNQDYGVLCKGVVRVHGQDGGVK